MGLGEGELDRRELVKIAAFWFTGCNTGGAA